MARTQPSALSACDARLSGAGGIVEGALFEGHGPSIVSARRSLLDLFTNDIGVGGVPVLYTVNAKAVYDLNVSGYTWDRWTNTPDAAEQLGHFPLVGPL